MSTAEFVVVICLAALGLAHSVLGETDLLRPLFAAEWSIGVPRWVAERIFRFAWHLTTITWFALAVVVAGGDVLTTIGVMSLVSAAMIFVMLRGHLAWPLFLLIALAAAYESDLLNSGPLQAATIATAALLVIAAAIHIYWAAGGGWMLDAALPQVKEGGYTPGPAVTLAVAAALLTFAALVLATGLGQEPAVIRWLTVAGTAVLAIRAIGDTKVVGFTKTTHNTEFGRADDQYFTPLIVFLALGATGALLA